MNNKFDGAKLQKIFHTEKQKSAIFDIFFENG